MTQHTFNELRASNKYTNTCSLSSSLGCNAKIKYRIRSLAIALTLFLFFSYNAVADDVFASFLDKVDNPACENISLKCDEKIFDLHWFLEAANLDLMQKEMETWRRKSGRRPVAVKVAVIDGNFGSSLNSLLSKSATFHRVRPELGSSDEGHGSWVSQFIQGKEGLGVAQFTDLHVYETGIPNSRYVDNQATRAAEKSACDDGQKIINESFGTNPAGSRRDEYFEEFSKSVHDLSEKGCLLVRAAGNESIREHRFLDRYNDLKELYLAVGATRKSGGVSAFSNRANIYAPGEALIVLSNEHSERERYCSPSGLKLIDGTSFSAPITTAVAANVSEILNSSAKFKSLEGVEQVKLLVKLIQGNGAHLDGLQAVKKAERWVENSSSPTLCKPIPLNCFAIATNRTCGPRQICSAAVRKMISQCPDQMLSQVPAFLSASSFLSRAIFFKAAEAIVTSAAVHQDDKAASIVHRRLSDHFWISEVNKIKWPFENLAPTFDLFLRLGKENRPESTTKVFAAKLAEALGSRMQSRDNIDLLNKFLEDKTTGQIMLDELSRGITGLPNGEGRHMYGIDTERLLNILTTTERPVAGLQAFFLTLLRQVPDDQKYFLASFADYGTRIGNTDESLNILQVLQNRDFPNKKELMEILIGRLQVEGKLTSEQGNSVRSQLR